MSKQPAKNFAHTVCGRTINRHPQQFLLSYRAVFCVLSVLLIALAGCGGATPSSNTNITPTTQPSKTTTATTQPASTATSSASGDWTMYHNDQARSGYLTGTPDPKSLSVAWNQRLDGAVYAEPLVVNGMLIVATENNSLYALDPQSGAQKWHANVGAPVSRSTLPCGNIDPLGITGTPVYDPQTKLIFAVAETSGPVHVLIGVDSATGTIKVQRNIDLPGMDASTHQERGALALINDHVYVPFGGLDGDCGQYAGRVIGIATSGQGDLLSYTVPTPREGGIWATPGPVVDANNKLYVAVGNGEVTSGDWDHSDSVLRLSPDLKLEDGFAPTTWPTDNASDADLGSMSPVLLADGQIFSAGKSGQGYLLRANALGGVGGQLTQQETCKSFGGAAVVGSQIFLPCTDGVLQIKIGSGSMTLGWKAGQNITGSPVVGGNTLYSLDPADGTLYALNTADGQQRAMVQVGMTSRFATPTISGKTVFVGTMQGITAVNIQ